ncbi:MAG: hypothetical protein ACRD22_15440, partial [Terriglobia bacterium]
MSEIDLAELKRLAKETCKAPEPNATDYKIWANPWVILALIERLETMETTLTRAQAEATGKTLEVRELTARAAELDAEVAKLKEGRQWFL